MVAASTHVVVDQLRAKLGDQVTIDDNELSFFAQDVYRRGEPLAAVVRPTSVEALQEAVRLTAQAGVPMIARGGGMSYTDAYLARVAESVLFDMSALDDIVELNETDRYVTVEGGCTWAKLYSVLQAKGLRTPYWGPLSGLCATVGGAASQGSIFLGSSRYGTVGDAVLGFDIVSASGELLTTGSAAHHQSAPFFRYYGPDLTGVFCNDAGALGFKARVTLRLLPAHQYLDFLSYEFADADSLLNAMTAVGQTGLASEVFAFDPYLQVQRMKRASLAADVKTLGKVMGSAGGVLKGIKAGAKLVTTGRNFLDDAKYSLHLTVEADSEGELEFNTRHLRQLVIGDEVENAIPKVLRADPFQPPTSILGPDGERWVPVHGIVPHSAAKTTFAALEAMFASHQEQCERLKVEYGYLMTSIAHSAILIEPVFYWPEARDTFHERVLDESYVKKLPLHDANPEATALVDQLRSEAVAVLRENGSTHFQIGKCYPYARDLSPATRTLVEALKAQLDPNGLINPGALGLGPGPAE